MEPAKIDWKNLEWRFVEDKAYEQINAPKWFDFLNPNDNLVNDHAWLCTPVQSLKDGRRFSQILTFQGFRAHLMFLGSFRLVIKSKGGETWDAQESDGGRLLELQQLQR